MGVFEELGPRTKDSQSEEKAITSVRRAAALGNTNMTAMAEG